MQSQFPGCWIEFGTYLFDVKRHLYLGNGLGDPALEGSDVDGLADSTCHDSLWAEVE